MSIQFAGTPSFNPGKLTAHSGKRIEKCILTFSVQEKVEEELKDKKKIRRIEEQEKKMNCSKIKTSSNDFRTKLEQYLNHSKWQTAREGI